MRKLFWFIPVLLVFATIGAPTALRAGDITYNINFSGGSPTPTSGTFTYDTTANDFTSFNVTFDGVNFNFLPSANGPVTQGSCSPLFTGPEIYALLTGSAGSCGGLPLAPAWDAFPPNPAGGTSTEQLLLTFFNSSNSGGLIGGGAAIPSPLPFTSGTFTVTTAVTPTPEPGTISLMLTGLGLLGLMVVIRNRKAQGIAQAT